METKKCPRCGRVLPISEFNKRAKSPDGLQPYCREYKREIYQESHLSKEKLLSNNPLSGYTPRELLAELKRRGYKWEKMYFIQEVKYENI